MRSRARGGTSEAADEVEEEPAMLTIEEALEAGGVVPEAASEEADAPEEGPLVVGASVVGAAVVGLVVGDRVVGLLVGAQEGRAGHQVGSSVGALVGAADMAAVGPRVGMGMGLLVGGHVSPQGSLCSRRGSDAPGHAGELAAWMVTPLTRSRKPPQAALHPPQGCHWASSHGCTAREQPGAAREEQ